MRRFPLVPAGFVDDGSLVLEYLLAKVFEFPQTVFAVDNPFQVSHHHELHPVLAQQDQSPLELAKRGAPKPVWPVVKESDRPIYTVKAPDLT